MPRAPLLPADAAVVRQVALAAVMDRYAPRRVLDAAHNAGLCAMLAEWSNGACGAAVAYAAAAYAEADALLAAADGEGA